MRRAVVLLAVAVFSGVACRSEKPAGGDTTADPRTPVALPADGQQAVLKEMRQMLGAIGGALSAAARGDTSAVLSALAPAGSAAAADPQLEALLPSEWKDLAEQTHGGFDSLAVAVRNAGSAIALKDTVLTGVAQISASCTSCHEQYRVTVR